MPDVEGFISKPCTGEALEGEVRRALAHTETV